MQAHSPRLHQTPPAAVQLPDDDLWRSMDVEFTCAEQAFLAHRFVLAQCSDVFREAFEQASRELMTYGFREGPPRRLTFSVDGVHPAAFKTMLDFCYTGRASLQDPALVEHLTALAQYYRMPSLMGLCQDFFAEHKQAVPSPLAADAGPPLHRSGSAAAHSDREIPRLPSLAALLGNLTDHRAASPCALPAGSERPPSPMSSLPLSLPPLRPSARPADDAAPKGPPVPDAIAEQRRGKEAALPDAPPHRARMDDGGATGYYSSLSPPPGAAGSPVPASRSAGPSGERCQPSSPAPIRYHYYEPRHIAQQIQLQQQQQATTRYAVVEELRHTREGEEEAWRFAGAVATDGDYPRHHSAPLAAPEREYAHPHLYARHPHPATTAVAAPPAFVHAAGMTGEADTANCHHCKTKKALWVRCPRIRTHRFCDRCVERHFMVRFERAAEMCSSGQLWRTGCPVCKLSCPCASCNRKRGKASPAGGGSANQDKPRNTAISKKKTKGAARCKSNGKQGNRGSIESIVDDDDCHTENKNGNTRKRNKTKSAQSHAHDEESDGPSSPVSASGTVTRSLSVP